MPKTISEITHPSRLPQIRRGHPPSSYLRVRASPAIDAAIIAVQATTTPSSMLQPVDTLVDAAPATVKALQQFEHRPPRARFPLSATHLHIRKLLSLCHLQHVPPRTAPFHISTFLLPDLSTAAAPVDSENAPLLQGESEDPDAVIERHLDETAALPSDLGRSGFDVVPPPGRGSQGQQQQR